MKLVSFRPVVRKDGNATCGYTAHMTSKPDNRDSDWRGEESRQWVKLTDHEAALAELEFSRNEWMKGAADLAEKLKASELRNTTLLTGLEALAGRMEAAPERPSGAHWAHELRTLASAGLEGK